MERDLVERARAGDRDAFEALVRSKVGTLYHLAVAILGQPTDADDATQEAFITAWRRLEDLRDLDRFDAWLTRILVNSC
ncbi:MAG: RNA polymerase sigma factor, partial [Candidatus Limnocylindrales bacterium]